MTGYTYTYYKYERPSNKPSAASPAAPTPFFRTHLRMRPGRRNPTPRYRRQVNSTSSAEGIGGKIFQEYREDWCKETIQGIGDNPLCILILSLEDSLEWVEDWFKSCLSDPNQGTSSELCCAMLRSKPAEHPRKARASAHTNLRQKSAVKNLAQHGDCCKLSIC